MPDDGLSGYRERGGSEVADGIPDGADAYTRTCDCYYPALHTVEGWYADLLKSSPKKRGAGALTKWTWVDKAPPFPARISKVVVQDRSPLTPGVVRVRVAARSRSFVTLAEGPPPSVTVVFDPATALQCGLAAFTGPPPAPACTLSATGASLVCH